jgi:hypothetical protein
MYTVEFKNNNFMEYTQHESMDDAEDYIAQQVEMCTQLDIENLTTNITLRERQAIEKYYEQCFDVWEIEQD